jgi:uncharacterized sulfatase
MSKSIVWITLDSLRRDYITLDGHSAPTTENLEAIVDTPSGEWVDSCITQGRWTPAATGSILTGSYLPTHGIGATSPVTSKLPDSLDSLPSLLKEAGYATGGVSTNVYLSETTALDRGFDRFNRVRMKNIHHTAGIRSLINYALNIRKYGGGLTADKRVHNSTTFASDIAKRWINDFSTADDPFFLYMHINSTHYPFTPPKPFAERFLDDDITHSEAIEISLDIYNDVHDVMAAGCDLSDREWRAISALYEAEIAFADEFVGKLFEHARSATEDDVIFLLTGDHGEHFGEKQHLGHHGSVHDTIINVPLVTYNFPAELDKTGPVEHIDLTRTLAEYAGVESEQFEGINLTEERREAAHTHLQPTTGGDNVDKLLAANTEFDKKNFREDYYVVSWNGNYKLFRNKDEWKLYRLPDESNEICESTQELVKELTTPIVEAHLSLEDWAQYESSDAFHDKEVMDRLEAMGYR